MLNSDTERLDIVIIGLSITSSWGNGHATTYRSLVKGLHELGHRVLFLEHDVPWYARHRDFTEFPYAKISLYKSIKELKEQYREIVKKADLVITGSYVVQGVKVIDWVNKTVEGVKAFYDIDTPVTLSKLRDRNCEYLHDEQIPCFDLYLSFTGGPVLEQLETEFYTENAKTFYCSVDDSSYFPEKNNITWDLGYLGTYSKDRQPSIDKFIIAAAKESPTQKFIVAGLQFPHDISWPANVERIDHIGPHQHRAFYNQQKFTLNVTRHDMIRTGFAPSVRLFEAAACAVPIISDYWRGLEDVLIPGEEILIAKDTRDVLGYLNDIDEKDRLAIGKRAGIKILKNHTSRKRAEELVDYYHDIKNYLPVKPTAQLVKEYSELNHGGI